MSMQPEIDKEFYQSDPIIKHLLSAVFAFIMLIGGYLFTKQGMTSKICALFLMLSPPVIIFLSVVDAHSTNIVQSLTAISPWQWFTIIGVICLTTVVAVLGA